MINESNIHVMAITLEDNCDCSGLWSLRKSQRVLIYLTYREQRQDEAQSVAAEAGGVWGVFERLLAEKWRLDVFCFRPKQWVTQQRHQRDCQLFIKVVHLAKNFASAAATSAGSCLFPWVRLFSLFFSVSSFYFFVAFFFCILAIFFVAFCLIFVLLARVFFSLPLSLFLSLSESG